MPKAKNKLPAIDKQRFLEAKFRMELAKIVCDELKISKYILQKIENDEFDQTINKVFYIGHLRAYANFLNLNVDDIIEQFKLQNSFEPVEILEKIPKPINQNTFFKLNKFLSFTSILVIFITFYFLFIEVEKPTPDYAIIPDIPEIFEPIVEKELINIEKRELVKNEQKTLQQKIEEKILSSSAFASSKINEDSINQTITLKFLNPTWLQLRDSKDEIVLSQLMSQIDEYTYDLNLKYSVTAGNAGNILVLINNNTRGKIGDFGEVVDSIVIDSNFNN